MNTSYPKQGGAIIEKKKKKRRKKPRIKGKKKNIYLNKKICG